LVSLNSTFFQQENPAKHYSMFDNGFEKSFFFFFLKKCFDVI